MWALVFIKISIKTTLHLPPHPHPHPHLHLRLPHRHPRHLITIPNHHLHPPIITLHRPSCPSPLHPRFLHPILILILNPTWFRIYYYIITNSASRTIVKYYSTYQK